MQALFQLSYTPKFLVDTYRDRTDDFLHAMQALYQLS